MNVDYYKDNDTNKAIDKQKLKTNDETKPTTNTNNEPHGIGNCTYQEWFTKVILINQIIRMSVRLTILKTSN